MTTVDIYDPPQCCATGACSPDADDELAQFASSLEWLKARGVAVSRYNLGHQPGAFVQNPVVKSTIDKEGMACLPMTIADGVVMTKGRYPTRSEFDQTLGRATATSDVSAASTGKRCCG